jgi:hypothetical protein
MNINDIKKSISEMEDSEILEAIRLLRHSRTTDDVVKVVKVKAAAKKEDDLAAKLLKLAGSEEALKALIAGLS